MLISSVHDKRGNEQVDESGPSAGFLRCVMSEQQIELNIDEFHFGDDDGDRPVDSDLDLYFKPKESQKSPSWPRRHVENIVHEGDTETDVSDYEIYDDSIQHINQLNNKIRTLLDSARSTSNLEFAIPAELDKIYEKEHQGKAAFTKELLHSINDLSGTSFTSCLPKSLLDYINTQSDDTTNAYMDSVITYVNRTIDQLRRISAGDFLTEKAKEKWLEVYDWHLPNRALTNFDQTLIARSGDPLPFNAEPITWNAIIHSDINYKTFNRIFDKKIVIEIPKEIRFNLFNNNIREVFVNCKMNLTKSSEHLDEKKYEEKVNVILELQSPIIEEIEDNCFDLLPIINSEPPPLPALENHSIEPQIESPPNSPANNNKNQLDCTTPPKGFEDPKDQTLNSSEDEIKFLNEDYEDFSLLPNSDHSETSENILECQASVLSSKSYVTENPSSSVLTGECPTTSIISSFDLTTTMQQINTRFPAIQENTEESSAGKKIKSLPKTRVKSPYENRKFFMEEQRRKKLLEIRQKREQKKRVVAEIKEPKPKARSTPAPQTSSSVTKLSITNKSFYNSIFGHKIRLAVDAQKTKSHSMEKETDLQISDNSEEEVAKEIQLSANECRVASRSCYMNDSGIDVALLPHDPEEYSSSVDDVIKVLLRGTDNVPVKLAKPSPTPQATSPSKTIQSRKMSKNKVNSPRIQSPVNKARHKVSVLECKKSIDKVYEFLQKVNANEPDVVSRKAPKTVSFGKPKLEKQKPKPKSLQQLSKPTNTSNQSPPPFLKMAPSRLESPRTPRKPKTPSMLETVINNPDSSGSRHMNVKKKFDDDDDREARGEAVRGPSITARLNALAQPRKPYVKAFNDELQQKAANVRGMTVNRQRSLSPTNKDVGPMHRFRQSRGGIETISSMSFRRPPVVSGQGKRSHPATSPRPFSPLEKVLPSPTQAAEPVEIGDLETYANNVKKAVSFKDDLKVHRASASSPTLIQEVPSPPTSPEPKPHNMMLRLPATQDYQLTPSSSESAIIEIKRSNSNTSTKAATFDDSELKCSTSYPPASSFTLNILSQESLALKEIFSDTAAFTLDIFCDKTVSTAVEAVDNDNQINDKNSTFELGKLEDALQKQINGGSPKKRLIKNFTLTPKHSMQQVLLLHSGDTGSCIAPLQTPAPSCIKITTSKSDTVAELGVFPLVSNLVNWESFCIPMQISTVGYSFPQHFNAPKTRQKRKPLILNSCRDPLPIITIKKTPKETRDLKKKTPKNLYKGQNKCDTVIKSAVINNALSSLQNLTLPMVETSPSPKKNTKHLQKCNNKPPETIAKIKSDTEKKKNDSTSSLDILVKLLNEIQKITTSQTRIASLANGCQQESSKDNDDLENSCYLLGSFDTRAKDMKSISTLEQMRQLDSTPSLYSFMLSSEADINNRIKLTTPLYINKEIGVNFPDKQLVSKYAGENFQTITVNNATNVSESLLKLIETHRPVLYTSENITQYDSLILNNRVDQCNIGSSHASTDNEEDAKKNVHTLGDVILDKFEEEILEKMVEEVVEEETSKKEEPIPSSIDKNKSKKEHTDALLKRIDELLASKSTRELKMVKDLIITKSHVSDPKENKLDCIDTAEHNTEIEYNDCINTEIVFKDDFVESSKADVTILDICDKETNLEENKNLDNINPMESVVEESNSSINIKRDILVTVYSVLAVTVLAALSLPEVLYFSDLNI